MTTSSRVRAAGAVALTFALALPSAVRAEEDKGVTSLSPTLVPNQPINSVAGPLTRIFVGDELSNQVEHILERGTTTPYSFYPPATSPGDSGTFMATGGVLYAPDFANHGGMATGSLGTFSVFTRVSQTTVAGSGTVGDPFRVTTVVTAGTTGLRLTKVDSYVAGQESFRSDVTIQNTSGSPQIGLLYHGIDCFLGGSDVGYGFVVGTAPGCTKTANNTPPERYLQLQPITGGNTYSQTYYGTIWSQIGAKAALPNTCGCTTSQDNGIAIAWSFSLGSGQSATYSYNTVIQGRSVQRRIADFDGDGISDLAVFAPEGGLWYVRRSSTGTVDSVGFGSTGYTPVAVDYDGDNKADIAVYHEQSGLWFIRNSLSSTTTTLGYGGQGYMPVPRDYDGDLKADVAVYHPSSGLWFYRQSASSNATQTVGYGGSGFFPVPNDFDGDGKNDLAVYHEASGLWFIRQSNLSNQTRTVGYGGTGFVPVPRDYDGDAKADPAVFHPSSGLWYILQSSTDATRFLGYGATGYTPVPADYDGDGKVDVAVYHDASGWWFARRSSDSTDFTLQFGGTGLNAVTLPPAYVPATAGCTGDTDGDRLCNNYETNNGVFQSATSTGTDPSDADTDDDGIGEATKSSAPRAA